MATHRHTGFEHRPRAGGGNGHGATARSAGAGRRARAALYRPPSAGTACPDCDGTGLRAAAFDPYGSWVLTCRSCMAKDARQNRAIFAMQLAFGCGIGLATLAVVLL